MKKFMGTGSGIEHEAFLSLWLARYVFQESRRTIRKHLFPIAVTLARGICVALAPAVLASIYRDFGFFERNIVAITKFGTGEDGDCFLDLILRSPFVLVQLWEWERFQEFRPKRSVFKTGDPRLAMWDDMRSVSVKNVRLALDKAGESFRWRPYVAGKSIRRCSKLYKEEEEWRDSGSIEEFLFALCLTVSELVGLSSIEPYHPHRVGRQFGMDQDIPAFVPRSNKNLDYEDAWFIYSRPSGNLKLYVPSRHFRPDVSIRYLEWWTKLKQNGNKNADKEVVRRTSFRRKPKPFPLASRISQTDKNQVNHVGFCEKYNERMMS